MKPSLRALRPVLLVAILAAGSEAQPLNRYWADLQGDNTNYGTPAQYFSFGRDSVGLDVVALTPHSSNTTDTRWVNIKAAAAIYNAPGSYVAFSGWEWNHDTWGHKVAYFLTDDQPLFRTNVMTSDHPNELYPLVATTNGLLHAAHPTLSSYVTNWNFYNDTLQPNAEIVSRWGVYETAASGRGVRDQWATGKRIGVLGSSDSHVRPGTEGGLTAILAPTLTRAAILDALRARHTYATNGARIGLDFHVGTATFGDVDNNPFGDAFIQVQVNGTAPISRVELRRSNTLVHAYSPPPQRVFVEVGAPLTYFKGQTEPAAGWNTLGFSDVGWLSGRSGLGFGNEDDVTVVTGMVNSYLTLYSRQMFTVTDNTPQYLYLGCDYDDGFVAYLDGIEVLRVNMPAGAITSTTPAGPFRNPNMAAKAVAGAVVPPFYTNNGSASGTPIMPSLDLFDLTPYAAMMVPGTHVLAIEVHNSFLSSGDVSLIPRLFENDPATTATVNFTDAGASGDRWYDAKIIQMDGGIAWSSPIWLNPDAPPRPVASLMDVPGDNGEALDLTWTKSIANDFNHYDIFVSDVAFADAAGMTPWSPAPITNPDSLSARITTFDGQPLQRGRTYWVYVGAADASGKMNTATVGAGTNGVPADNIPPQPPSGLAVIDTPNDDGGNLRVTWSLSPDDGAGMGDVAAYQIFRRRSSSTYTSTPLATRPAGSTSFEDNTPADGTNYHFRIRATDGSNTSIWSAEFGPVTSVNNGGLAEPKNVAASDRAGDQGGWIRVTWSLIGADASITRYNVYRATSSGVYGPTPHGWVPNGVAAYFDSTAADATNYWYAVQSDSAGVRRSTLSTEAGPAQALDNIGPAAIAALTATNPAIGGTVHLDWAGYDQASQGDVAGYDIYLRTSSITSIASLTPAMSVPAGTFAADVTGLVNGTNYFFAVAPADEAGNHTNTVISRSARPTDTTPPVFAGLTAATPGDASLTLAWNAAQDNTLPITYRLFQSLTPGGFNYTTPLTTIPGTAPIVPLGAPWRFLKGTSAPPVAWRDRNYDDSGWLQGEGAFGYDTANRYQLVTPLSDMNSVYTSVYFRANFNLASIPQSLVLGALVDDGFIAYLNGVEVARDNLSNPANYNSLAQSGVNPAWNAVLDPASPSNYNPNPTLTQYDLTPFVDLLVIGRNTVSFQVHNYRKTNPDFLFLAELSAANVRHTVTGLSSSQTYYYVMRAIDGAANLNTNTVAVSGRPLQPPRPMPVMGLTAVKSGSSVLLRWAPVVFDSLGAGFVAHHYNVYRGTTAGFVPDVAGHTNLLASPTGTSFTDPGALNLAGDLFYRLTAVSATGRESYAPSALALKSGVVLAFAAGTANRHWIAIPYLSGMADAQSLVNDLNRGPIPGPVLQISRHDAQAQTLQTLRYDFGAWVGDNFALAAGEAYAITLQTNLSQSLVGAHNPTLGLNFQFRTTTSNIYWLGLPYHADYADAQSLLDHLNSGPMPSRVSKIVRFDPATGAPLSYLYFAGQWQGQNFGLVPGQGYGIVLKDAVNGWRPLTR